MDRARARNVEAYLSDAAKKWAQLHAIEAEIGGAGVRAVDYAQQRSDLNARPKTGHESLKTKNAAFYLL